MEFLTNVLSPAIAAILLIGSLIINFVALLVVRDLAQTHSQMVSEQELLLERNRLLDNLLNSAMQNIQALTEAEGESDDDDDDQMMEVVEHTPEVMEVRPVKQKPNAWKLGRFEDRHTLESFVLNKHQMGWTYKKIAKAAEISHALAIKIGNGKCRYMVETKAA